MRIALLTPRFWPEVRRGTERFVHELASSLIGLGHEPLVITASPGPGEEAGVAVQRVRRLPERALEPLKIERHLTHLPWAARALSRFDPDVVHAFHIGDAWLAARTGKPAVFTHMGIPDARDLHARRGRRRMTERVARELAVSVLTERAADAWKETTGFTARAIAPGVALDRFPLGRERTPEPTVVCAAAATEPRKRVDVLLEAWPGVRERHPGARLLLDRRGARAVHPVPEGVELTDMDDTATLAALTGRAWAAALASKDEAFGLVALEALATGTPAVCTTREVVDRPSVGRVFDGSPAGLLDALDHAFALAQHPGTRDACRARAGEFPARTTAERYVALYAQLR